MVILIAAAGSAAAQWSIDPDSRAGTFLRNAGEVAQDTAVATGRAIRSGAAKTGVFVGHQMENAGAALSRTAKDAQGVTGPDISPPGEEPDVPWAYGLGE